MTPFAAEADMVGPLLKWLQAEGRVDSSAVVIEELQWSGRRVDLAVLSRGQRSSAFELKRNGTRRAVLQATYNRLAFDHAYVVSAVWPSERNLRIAADAGVGIILLDGQRPRLLQRSPRASLDPRLRRKLARTIQEAGHVRQELLPLPQLRGD